MKYSAKHTTQSIGFIIGRSEELSKYFLERVPYKNKCSLALGKYANQVLYNYMKVLIGILTVKSKHFSNRSNYNT